jgi:hypothetical protein
MDTQDERGAVEMEGDQKGAELGADALAGRGVEILREVNQLDGGGGDARRPSEANPQVRISRLEILLLKSEGPQLPRRQTLCVLEFWTSLSRAYVEILIR